MIYAVNLTTNTKSTDLYDKVAVNKFPIIVIANNDEELKNNLSSKETNDFVKNSFRTEHLYKQAVWYIRKVYNNNIIDMQWNVPEINKIEYKKEEDE